MRRFRLAMATFVLASVAVGACASADAEEGAIHVLTIDGDIGPITERYIDRGYDRAEENAARLVLIEMDTPGGLSSSMRDIVQRIEAATVPTAVYVTPAGGRAASAGTFITMAAHVAAMAPNTSIGAASAINSDGSDIDGTLGRKVENDSVAFIRGIAELRGRNADWAEDAVRDAVAATQSEAVELNVVDFVALDREEILRRMEGTTVELRPGTTVEMTGLVDARVVETEMTPWEKFLELIADPNLATILLGLGFLALVFEVANPGAMLPGVAGVIMIAIGFLAFGVMPVDTIGIVLIALALALFAAELFVQSGGILGGGGVVALLLGGVIAFSDTPAEFQPNRILVGAILVVVATLFVSLAIGIARIRKMPSVTGSEELIGKLAVARTALTPGGMVFLQGERWSAELGKGRASEGDMVRVTGFDGFRLRVERAADEPEEEDPDDTATPT